MGLNVSSGQVAPDRGKGREESLWPTREQFKTVVEYGMGGRGSLLGDREAAITILQRRLNP